MVNDSRNVDLHIHSSYSDGTMTPKELVDYAHSMNLQGVAITDHDSIESAYETCLYAPLVNMIAISGVELSAEWNNQSIHILGYAFHPRSQILQQACTLHAVRREERNREILEKLRKKGMHLAYEEILLSFPTARTIGRPHIAQLLVEKGYVANLQDAFKRYLGEKKTCYVAGKKWSIEEAIELIQKAQGFAILAHPHLLARFRQLEELMNFPFDGLEAYYGSFCLNEHKKFISYAESHNLLMTGGSDFHGSIKPKNRLGSSFAPEKSVEIFVNRMKEHTEE